MHAGGRGGSFFVRQVLSLQKRTVIMFNFLRTYHAMLYGFLLGAVSLMTMPALAAGPSGEEAEKVWLYDNVILSEKNLFGDELPLRAPLRILNRAWQELRTLEDDAIAGYGAAFIIFTPDGKPILLDGALLPGGDALEDIHTAVMHIRADGKARQALNVLPENTIVYAVDGSGNKAWYPLKFFKANTVHPGYLTSEGFYAYTYRPSPKLYGRYGRAAYYIDLMNATQLENGYVVPKENITLMVGGLPDMTVRVAWYVSSAFFAPLIPLLAQDRRLAATEYEITLVAGEGTGGLLAVKLPFGIESEPTGDGQRVYPCVHLIKGLELYKEAIISSLEFLEFPDLAGQVRGMDLGVIMVNELGQTRLVVKDGQDGVARTELSFTSSDDNTFFRFDGGPDGVVFGAAGAGNMPEALKSHLDHNYSPTFTPLPSPEEDWRAVYDTTIYDLPRSMRERKVQKDKEEPGVIGPGRHFELDVQPTFSGGNFDDFLSWLLDEIEARTVNLGNHYDRALVKFMVDEEGAVQELVVSSSSAVISTVIRHVMAEALDGWTPGEIVGVPVKVRYRFDIVPEG